MGEKRKRKKNDFVKSVSVAICKTPHPDQSEENSVMLPADPLIWQYLQNTVRLKLNVRQ